MATTKGAGDGKFDINFIQGLDTQIATLLECKPLPESEIRALCDKVSSKSNKPVMGDFAQRIEFDVLKRTLLHYHLLETPHIDKSVGLTILFELEFRQKKS